MGAHSPGTVSPPQQADGVWRIDVVTADDSLSDEAQQLVRDIRASDAPFPFRVGGGTAAFMDR